MFYGLSVTQLFLEGLPISRIAGHRPPAGDATAKPRFIRPDWQSISIDRPALLGPATKRLPVVPRTNPSRNWVEQFSPQRFGKL